MKVFSQQPHTAPVCQGLAWSRDRICLEHQRARNPGQSFQMLETISALIGG